MSIKLRAKELGFGSMASEKGQRFINPDGSANARRIGGPLFSASDVFHKLIQMSWHKFFFMVLVCYAIANIIFASLYFSFGVQEIGILPSGNAGHDFLECFFFSTQCFTTIGFGRVNPQGIGANTVASAEGLIGLLTFAIATGLLYGRFSRPRAHLMRSENLLIAPYKVNQRAAMFRIASTRKHSLLVDNTVSMSLGINLKENGQYVRRFYALNLELDRINFLATSWTLVHPIKEESPLFGLTQEEIVNGRAEFIVLFRAMEETTSQITLERFSYFVDEIIWGAKFDPMIGTTDEGQPIMNLDLINQWKLADLPELSHALEPTATEG